MDGVRIKAGELAGLRGAARNILRRPSRRSATALPGIHRAFVRGRGMDFDESRLYQHGDDVKRIDWRVTARTGHTHTKLYREETERTLYLVVDVGTQMAFGTRRQLKSVLAARFAALLAWIAIERGDCVGALITSELGLERIRPCANPREVAVIFDALERLQVMPGVEGDGGAMARALAEASKLREKQASAIVIGDLLNDAQKEREIIRDCTRYRRTSIACVIDPIESSLPISADYLMSDGQRQWTIIGRDKSTRARYADRFADRWTQLNQECLDMNAALLPLVTAERAEDLIAGAGVHDLMPG
jgi:uncharacterized protein (DUF58 family)